jgi:transposase
MDRRYVGIDLHRRRSVIYAMDAEGERLFCERIDNDALGLLEVVSAAGDGAEVVIEATCGWYWAVDLVGDAGLSVHRAHPSGNDWGKRRVKNDERDARDLADLLRLSRLAEAWIAPPAVREARELVRYRARLVQLRSGLKAQVHAVMAKEGVLPGSPTCSGPRARRCSTRWNSCRPTRCGWSRYAMIEGYDREVAMLEHWIHGLLRDDRGYQAIQALDGVGRTLGAIFVTEIGDITRFRSPAALCSWAGLTPRHRQSDTKVVRGKITKQGSKLVRWAALAAIVPLPRRTTAACRVLSRCGTTRHQQGPHRDRAPAHDPRLLRPPRWRDPLPPAGGRLKLGHDRKRARNRHDTHHHGDVDELIEPLRIVARPHHAAHRGRGQMPGNRATTQHDTLVRNPVNELLETPRRPPLDHARPRHA